MSPISVLLVDDNPTFLRIAADFLRAHEEVAVVGTASGGEEAVARAQHLRPQVVLLDLLHPDLPGLEVIPRLRSELSEVVADRTAMGQVVGNLLNNAVTYLEPGRPGEIEVSGERAGNGATFHVRDNGRGIAERDRDKVFTPFRRAGKEDVPGEGMGLAYVQALIRRHGGRMWFESEPGQGSTFHFTVEAREASPE